MKKTNNFFFRPKNWHNILFVLLILLACSLRLIGVYPGFPPYHPDEGMSYAQGISIITERNLNANGYNLHLAYPSLIPIINAFFFKIFFIPLSWAKYFIVHVPDIMDGLLKYPFTEENYLRIFQSEILGNREVNVVTWGRTIAAFFGIGIVFLTYTLARQMFNKWTGLIVGFLVAVNYRQVLNSHFDLPDIYNAFFLLTSLIFSYRLIKNKSKVDFLIAGIFLGLSVSTKFSLFAIPSFVLACVFSGIINWKKIILSFFVAGLVFLIINPFHLINIEETRYLLHDVSLKYGTGKYLVNPYPFWYLFNFGIGKIASFLILFGMVTMLILRFKKFAFLSSTVLLFFFIVTFYTNGGFYTRNFVTITPVLLIYAAYLINWILKIKANLKYFLLVFVLVLLSLSFIEAMTKAVVVPIEYSKKWNFEVVSRLITSTIPSGARIAAHSSVPLYVDDAKVIPLEPSMSFSLQELIEEDVEYAVVNLDWTGNDFYWWMNRFDLSKWDKPIEELKKQYTAMATEELSRYALGSVFKNVYAPESNFVITKIPRFIVNTKKEHIRFDYKDNKLESEVFNIEDLSGLVVEGKVKNGYIFVNFYKSSEESKLNSKRITSAVSARERNTELTDKEIVTKIPDGAKYAVVGYGKYLPSENSAVEEIIVYNADVKLDNDYRFEKIEIEDGIMFPDSHGNM